MANALTRRVYRVCALLFAASVAGCGDTTPTGPSYDVEDLRAALTPELAALLDAEGRFVFPAAVAVGEPMITEERARALALAFYGTTDLATNPWVLHTRPQGVDADLEPCGPAYFMESAYEQPLEPPFPEHFRRVFGARWIVRLCHRGRQQLAIAVPVRDTGAEITADGKLGLVGDFWACYQGVADGASVPPSPEVGAVEVSRAVRTRVAAVPVLRRLTGEGCQAIFGSTWYYDLESQVEVWGAESDYPRLVSQAGYAFPTVLWAWYDLPRWWTYNVVVAPNPWYANEPVEEPFSFYDPAIEGGRPVSLYRRAEIPYHNERISARRR
jgi:hypothetical protein